MYVGDAARERRRFRRGGVLASGVLAVVVAALAYGSGEDMPAPRYHTGPPSQAFRNILPATLFSDLEVSSVYAVAAKIPDLLYQLPCYCYCDRTMSHQSLLDCFRGKHAAECDICRQEAVFAYCEHRKGLSPARIRKAIAEGGWERVDLRRLSSPLSSSRRRPDACTY
ncbi:MAG: hypothetical protein JO340_20960 [Acidobacteriaceae bacterium]|nr:hypothetical protein [Acidobacteriaceae bacterium]